MSVFDFVKTKYTNHNYWKIYKKLPKSSERLMASPLGHEMVINLNAMVEYSTIGIWLHFIKHLQFLI